jgi:thiol-disulfide isomerase/thioredoxin
VQERTSTLTIVATIVTVVVSGAAFAADAGITVESSDGEPVDWTDWVAESAPVAIVLWASWTPGSESTVEGLGELAAAARARGLGLVVVSVQEDFDEARRALGEIDVPWLHDRYGSLLKHYRVVQIPTVLVVAEDGRAMARLEASPESISAWKGE